MRTVGEYKVLNKKIADYMGYEVIPMETSCGSCGTRIVVGEEVLTDKNFNSYCDNRECGQGIATYYTTLEPCWWGDEYMDENDLCFHSNWNELIPVIKKVTSGGYTAGIQQHIFNDDILSAYNLVLELIEREQSIK